MLRFIYGPAGSGKTDALVKAAAESLRLGRRVFVLTPEQAVLETERKTAEGAGNAPFISLEVLSFTRLANRVFREYGGLSYNYIDRGGRTLVMWRVLDELSPLLSEYGSVSLSDRSMIHLMLSTVKELKSCGITPAMLERASERLSGDDSLLSRRVSDLALIYAAYENILRLEYDDPQDDLTKLEEKLREHDFFCGADVFIDSFNSFTGRERDILRHIMRQAANLTVTLGYLPEEAQPMFENLRRTEIFLRDTAASHHIELAEPIYLRETARFKNRELASLESMLRHADLDGEAKYTADIVSNIRTVECRGMFSECEFVMRDISRRIMEGARYRDIGIIARNLESYEGIIDALAEKHEIPLFMSRRTDIKSHPLIRFILTALGILRRGWQTVDVISCIKTGLSGISPEECDLLEGYASVWRVSGSRWYDGDDWQMNPGGYLEEMDTESEARLAKINEIRRRFALPLYNLGLHFGGGSVAEITAALYNFLLESGSGEAIISSEFASERVDAEGNARLWRLLIESLDKLVLLLGDMTPDAEDYAGMLELLLDEVDIGSLPRTVDEVTAGNASLLRSGEVEHVYIIGACDGIFPAVAKESGFFSDGDREMLEEIGISLAPGSEYKGCEELFFFYRAATSPSSSLTILYPTSDMSGAALRPSYMISRIAEHFTSLKVERDIDSTPTELIWNKNASFEFTALLRDTEAGAALRELYSDDTEYANRIRMLDTPITDIEASLSPEVAERLYGGSVALTQSRLDSYVLCRFAHCCRYIVKLSEKKKGSFEASDIGSFMHRVLEVFMRGITEDGRVNIPPRAEREAILDRVIDDYIESICRDKKQNNNRLLHLFERLRTSAHLLVNNLADEFEGSLFVPRFFELPISFDEGAVKPLALPLPDGTNAYLRGVCDRVDTYERDGKIYLRVIDYKTGTKDFSLDDVSMGLNLQLLLYLFALWRGRDNNFKAALGVSRDTEILPAGVLYFSAKAPIIPSELPMEREEIEKAASDAIKRQGMLTSDIDILRAMEPALEGKFIPVKLAKSGDARASCTLASLEGFGQIMNNVSETVTRISCELKRGAADARPLKNAAHDACEFCAYKPICRRFGEVR